MRTNRVLFIDDDLGFVESVINDIEPQKDSLLFDKVSFTEREEKIFNFTPDIIILDLKDTSISGDPSTPGIDIAEDLWKLKFCPLVFYTGFPEMLSDDENHIDNPFIEVVKKGPKSINELVKKIESFIPQVEAIHKLEDSMKQQYAESLKHLAPFVFKIFPDPEDRSKRTDFLIRTTQRRIAALLDTMSYNQKILVNWEQYIYPPLNDDLTMGDVLFKRGSPDNDPTAYFIILTPSCDIVITDAREPKVKNVLLSGCVKYKDCLAPAGYEGVLERISQLKEITDQDKKAKKREKIQETLISLLNRGYSNSILPLPSLATIIPPMAVNLRDLHLVPFGTIKEEYQKKASIDSPFRELISWAYIHVGCRPGLPDRDFSLWSDEIITEIIESR